MYTLYVIDNTISGRQYVGITKNSLKQRFAGHKSAANSGKQTPLYAAMRKYGVDKFVITEIATYSCFEDCAKAEIDAIAQGSNLYNVAPGGLGGNCVSEHNKEEWKAKLREARAGRKPALGMKHTAENILLFAECAKRKVPTYPSDVTSLSFKDASTKYGISKTHFYRLLKRAKSNDLS